MSDTESARRQIESTNARLVEAYAAGDLDTVVGAFAEDCWQMPPHAEPLVGRAALRGFWEQAFQWGTWRFTLETQDVVVSGPVAVERGTYRLNFSADRAAPSFLPSFDDSGNYVVMWRRDADGRWRAVWDAPVSSVPLPAPPV